MIPAGGFPRAEVKGSIMRCSKPPPMGWRSHEWTILGGRQSGGTATLQTCGGELYYFGEYVGILSLFEVEQVDFEKPIPMIEKIGLAYIPAVWYLVG